MASYAGNLVAFLAVERQKIPFRTLHDLLVQEDYTFGVLSNTILALLFQVCQILCCLRAIVTRIGKCQFVRS